jgi:hypothetical protein
MIVDLLAKVAKSIPGIALCLFFSWALLSPVTMRDFFLRRLDKRWNFMFAYQKEVMQSKMYLISLRVAGIIGIVLGILSIWGAWTSKGIAIGHN